MGIPLAITNCMTKEKATRLAEVKHQISLIVAPRGYKFPWARFLR